VALARNCKRSDEVRRLHQGPLGDRDDVAFLDGPCVAACRLVEPHVDVQGLAGDHTHHHRIVLRAGPRLVVGGSHELPLRRDRQVRDIDDAIVKPSELVALDGVEAHDGSVVLGVAVAHHASLVRVRVGLRAVRVDNHVFARVPQVQVVSEFVHLRRDVGAPLVVEDGPPPVVVAVRDPPAQARGKTIHDVVELAYGADESNRRIFGRVCCGVPVLRSDVFGDTNIEHTLDDVGPIRF